MRYRIKDGLDIPIAGEPEQKVYPGPPVGRVAISGLDYQGLKPAVMVTEGESVRLGQPLFTDKRDPAVKYTSPASGTVMAIKRGARRALESVIVRVKEGDAGAIGFDAFSNDQLRSLDRELITGQLQRSGAWTAFRTRPFSRVPASDAVPCSIFVTAIDSQPLAPDPKVVVGQDIGAFNTGLRVLLRLTPGKVHLCTAPGWDLECAKSSRLQLNEFLGPHPAGLPGTHIHFIDPVGADRTVWHVSYQDVMAIGGLFATGQIDTRRVVAIAGDPLAHPRLISTRLGASVKDLLAPERMEPVDCRVISGSVLTGRAASGDNAFLGRYHAQISLVRESRGGSLFGWLGLVSGRYSASATFLKKTGHRRRYRFTTARNGRYAAMLPVRIFDKVLPLDILPSSLFRALMVRDTNQAQALGCLELDEEDLALCSFVCPAKYDYGAILRLNLDQIEKEG
jgi:Na+-transporting NADH:ubiquinone oxidoreductase subunit A